MINPNYTSTPFPGEPSVGDQHHQFFVPNYQSSASSSSFSCHRVFFNTPQDDQTEYYHTTLVQHQEGENRAGSYDVEKKDNQSLKLTLWKNEKQKTDEENPAKWMPPKMRLVQKMKNSAVNNSNSNSSMVNLEDQQISSFESDQYLCSNVSSSYNSNPTVRVCADCNTTKTPLWRSGPKGPKSLCNACGIRQRKARRAMAAAAAAANGTSLASETATLKIKVQNNKEKIKHNNIHGHHAPQFKKRCKLTVAESSSSSSHHGRPKKNVFEDFLFNLSKNLAFHRVFPQDEKEAAILLMALSCGLVHG